MQTLSCAEKCFKCHQFEYIIRNCLTFADNNIIEENEKSEKDEL